MAEGAQWGGQPIKLIVPSLKLAGAAHEDVAHALAYLTDPDDYSCVPKIRFYNIDDEDRQGQAVM